MDLIRALQVEISKLKRTLALWLVFLTPLAVVILMTLNMIRAGQGFLEEGYNPWLFLSTNSLGLWAFLMLPLFISLETALLGNLEYRNDTWKHMFVLPVSRATVYLAKQILALGLIGLSTVALVLMTLITVPLINFFGWIPAADMSASIPWTTLFLASTAAYFASWFIIALHTWIGLRWQNFIISPAVGIVATVAGFIASNAENGYFFPWSTPARVTAAFTVPDTSLPLALLIGTSIIMAMVVMLAGAFDMQRRDIL